jgi:hypothetical protein
MSALRRISDGVLFQAVLTGSLSFSHIHDLAAAHGQGGWKAWLYPLSVDLLTVAAYRKLTAARSTDAPSALAWCSFLLGLGASLAANIAGAWQNPDRLTAVALGVWPAVAFLVCTLLTHNPEPRTAPAPDVDTSTAVERVPGPAPEAPAESAPTPERPAVESTPAEPADTPASALPEVSPKFLEWARRVAEQHQREHGAPIDLGTLRARLKVNEPLARAVHAHLIAGTAGA